MTMKKDFSEENGALIEGRNAVSEALRAGRRLDKVYVAAGDTDATLKALAAKARAAGAVVSETDRRKLDSMSESGSHQGIIALAAIKEYASVEDILDIAAQRGEAPLVIICDGITDPHNLGAIIRTAEAVGVHGIIIPKHRSAGVTATVEKTSAGAVEHMAVARVTNIAAEIEKLKKLGVWIYGTAADAPASVWETSLTGPAAIVIGSEGDGMSRLVREKCDFLVSIPMRGKVSSLNASVSAALLIYEAMRQRGI